MVLQQMRMAHENLCGFSAFNSRINPQPIGKVIEIAFRNDFVMAEGEKKKKKKAGWFKLPAIAVVKTKPVFHFPLGQMWEA